jgi:hypothetical protein
MTGRLPKNQGFLAEPLLMVFACEVGVTDAGNLGGRRSEKPVLF